MFPLHQIANVGVNLSNLFGREIIFGVHQPACKTYLNVTDRRTTDGRTAYRVIITLLLIKRVVMCQLVKHHAVTHDSGVGQSKMAISSSVSCHYNFGTFILKLWCNRRENRALPLQFFDACRLFYNGIVHSFTATTRLSCIHHSVITQMLILGLRTVG